MIRELLVRNSTRAIAITAIVLSVLISLPVLNVQGASPFEKISVSSETTGEITPAILLTRETLEQYDGPSIRSVIDVKNDVALINFAASRMREDRNIQSISLGQNSVSMTYRSEEDVFRFGSRIIERTATISTDGYISITKPWYARIMSTRADLNDPANGFSDLLSGIQSDVLPPEDAARLLTRMHGRFQIGAL